ncbi:uncharacterized protein K02A2.6-like [Pantherophis guttatus]|uniref:Gypsy retrotransposon integrase-like protein 1 n=1 Tax=Pantherophis guttatus TaxID=94885 RepID=A0ABM3YUD7_PANGU|nr:uncharacterized protein K02A2.6-like [Pantherophis guttatus]
MKALARSLVWWPLLDSEIEQWVASCSTCQLSRPAPPAAPVREWEAPRYPWARIHMDLAGPFRGQMFLVVVDAYSKWVELAVMHSTTSEAIVKVLERLFATHGLPDLIVTDNGPQFTSAPFQMFLAMKGIRHATTAPYHPAANGLAERAVRSAKEALSRLPQSDWHHTLNQYMLAQHTTPCPVTKFSPAELLMGRRLRTPLDRLHPSYAPDTLHDTATRFRTFAPGDLVYAQNYGSNVHWLPGCVLYLTGPYSYRVQLDDGRECRRHINQLRRRVVSEASAQPSQPITTRGGPEHPPTSPLTTQAFEHLATPEPSTAATSPDLFGSSKLSMVPAAASAQTPEILTQDTPAPPPTAAAPVLRRSGRSRRRPPYLEDYACAIRQRGPDHRTNRRERAVFGPEPRMLCCLHWFIAAISPQEGVEWLIGPP